MFAQLKKARENNERGFTLIEMIVVIVIIGILAAIAIPLFLNQRKSAVDSEVQSDVKNAATQIESLIAKKPSGKSVGVTSDGQTVFLCDSATAPTTPDGTCVTAQNRVSQGTTLSITTSDPNGYVLVGTNDGGDKATPTSGGIKYDSSKGGLQK